MIIKAKTKGMYGTKVEGFKEELDLENATEEELLASLKQLFKQEKEERLQQLNLLFKTNHYLSPEFILDALIAKAEWEMEEDEIDDHMIESAEMAMSQMGCMYVSWLGW